MKILALVFAARREEKSATLRMTNELCGMIGRRCPDAAFEVLTMSELPVRPASAAKAVFLRASARRTGRTAWPSCGGR